MQLDTVLNQPLAEVAAQADHLESVGFDGLFTYEGQSDPFLPFVAAAAATKRVMLYSNVAIGLPRSPIHLAQQAWDLQRLSGGRFILGLGSQIKAHIERRYSARWDRPVSQMRELIEATRSIMNSWQNQVPLDYRGEYYTHTLDSPLLTPKPLDDCRPPPIWAGALGPRMTRMVAETADGIILHPFNSARYLHSHSLLHVEEGLATAQRSRAGFGFGVGVIVAAYRNASERAAALAAVRVQLGFYGSTPAYRVVLDSHGWGELQPELRRLTRQGRWGDLGGVWSDEQVDTLAVAGTPTEVVAEIRSRYAGIADRISMQLTAGSEGVSSDIRTDIAKAWKSN